MLLGYFGGKNRLMILTEIDVNISQYHVIMAIVPAEMLCHLLHSKTQLSVLKPSILHRCVLLIICGESQDTIDE